jgi:hypothetical protein
MEGLNMPTKTKEKVEPVVDDSVEIRHPNGDTEKVRPAAADILCRKAGCVDVAKEKAAKEAAEKAAAEAEEKKEE